MSSLANVPRQSHRGRSSSFPTDVHFLDGPDVHVLDDPEMAEVHFLDGPDVHNCTRFTADKTSNDPIVHHGHFGYFEVIEVSVTLVDEVQGHRFSGGRGRRDLVSLEDDSEVVDFLEVETIRIPSSSPRSSGPATFGRSGPSSSHSLSLTLSSASTHRTAALVRKPRGCSWSS